MSDWNYVWKHKKTKKYFVSEQSDSWDVYVAKVSTKKLSRDFGVEIVPDGACYYPKDNCNRLCSTKEAEKHFRKEGIIMDKLYEFEVEGKTLYGTKLAVNSQGQWVMDVKGSAPVAIDKDEATEVIPHAIKVGIDGTVHTMLADKDKFKVGEVYFNASGKIAVVKAVDVKERTSQEFKPVAQILTKPL